MKIQEAAVKIISQWENKGHYNVSANQTYGLLGWHGQELERLLTTYKLHGAKRDELDCEPKWYADTLMTRRHDEFTDDFVMAETHLNVIANDPIMRHLQHQQAETDMVLAIITAHKWYSHFESPLSQLILCDMAVSAGRHDHNYVMNCGAFPSDDEETVLVATMKRRTKLFQLYGIWQRDPQLRARCNFYMSRIRHKDWDLSGMQSQIYVNGAWISFEPEPIEPLARNYAGVAMIEAMGE